MSTGDDEGPTVNWDAARRLTGGDDDLLDELVELFPAEGAKQLAAIRAAVESEDAEAMTRAAHTLKSSARLIGAESLADRALIVETLGRSSTTGEAARALPDLERELGRVVEALKQRPVS